MTNNKSKLNSYLLIVLIVLVLVVLIVNISNSKSTKSNKEVNYYQQNQTENNLIGKESQFDNSIDLKEYQLGNSYFKYKSGSNIKTGELSNGLYADISNGDKLLQIKYYKNSSDTKPFIINTSNPTMVIGDKTFYYNDVLAEGDSLYRSYWYKDNNQIITISGQSNDFSLIDLSSIHID